MSEPLRFLADMNLSPLTVDDLQTAGWDIIRVSSLLPATASDMEVLALARQENRVVVTQDLDFSALLALGGYDRPSLITLRLSNTNPALVTQRLRQILPQVENALRQGCAATADEKTVRIRKLPIA
jgi:predicted nuclease of predicted toxin-antitoxin system